MRVKKSQKNSELKNGRKRYVQQQKTKEYFQTTFRENKVKMKKLQGRKGKKTTKKIESYIKRERCPSLSPS